jgi:hypothetical protein
MASKLDDVSRFIAPARSQKPTQTRCVECGKPCPDFEVVCIACVVRGRADQRGQ